MAFVIRFTNEMNHRGSVNELRPGDAAPFYASLVKVFYLKKNGKPGRLLRVEDKEGKEIEGGHHGN